MKSYVFTVYTNGADISATQLQLTLHVNYFSASPEQTHATEYRMN